MQDRLSAVLQGKDKPADASETLEFAELCGLLGQEVAAARLYAEALDASPRLAGDLHADHRYRAACAATLAGCGRGADGAGLSEAEQARWRQRAREWLRAEVTLWTSVLDERSARRSLPGCPEAGASVGRSPTGRAAGPRSAGSVAAGRAPGMPRTAGRDRCPDPAR